MNEFLLNSNTPKSVLYRASIYSIYFHKLKRTQDGDPFLVSCLGVEMPQALYVLPTIEGCTQHLV
jgi:hypothetical protein